MKTNFGTSRVKSFFLYVLTSIFLLPFVRSSAAFQVTITPMAIDPGDAFAVRATGVTTPQPPDAFLHGSPILLTSCGEGCFVGIGAVDIKTRPGTHTVQLYVGKRAVNIRLGVNRAHFPRRTLTLPDEKVFLSPEDSERAEKEEDKLESIYSIITDRMWEGAFIYPLNNDVSTPFGTRRILNKKKVSVHHGVDMKGREGDEVKASNGGTVVLCEELFFGGNTVIIDHGQGIFTTYMHLSSINAGCGKKVLKGDCIGYVGSSGRSTGAHLHFGAKVMQISVNPLSLVRLQF